MKNHKDSIAEGLVQVLPLIYNTLNQDSANKPLANQADLTHLQSHILESLFQSAEGISISVLAKQINISKQQMTPILQKLEEGGYIEKVRDPNDKRSFKIMLSVLGKQVITRKWEGLYHHFSQKLEQISEEDQVDLDYAIYKLNYILGKLQ